MISAEDLESFLLELRESDGFAIGLDELLKVRSLLRRLQAENRPQQEPEDLRRFVGPIVCRSGRDQDLFRQRFARRFLSAPKTSAVETPPPALPPAEQAHVVAVEQEIKTRQRWGLATILAVGGLLLALAVWLGVRFLEAGWSPTNPSQQNPIQQNPIQQPTLQYDSNFSVSLERLSLASVPLWLVLAVYFGWRSRYSVLARDLAIRSPNTRSVALDAAWRSLFAGREFRTGLRWLRAYRQIESDTPDIPRSLQSLLRTGYVAELHHKTRPEKPGHLLLVARETPRDHQTALAAVLAEKLREAHVEVARFDFFRRPLRLRPVRRDGGLRPGNLPLAQLATSHGRDRLLIIDDGVCFFHGLSRQPYPWVKQFDAWEERYLLTPLPPAEWGWRERRLAELGFAVIPATSRALAAPDMRLPTADEGWGPYPAVLPQATQAWPSRAPDAAGLEVLLAQLELYLGPGGFVWLCACAVFPELHPEITLRLGVALPWRGETLFSEPRLLALSRLPWFRTGEMPRWLRLALVRRLPKPQDQAVQTQLREILTTSRAGQTGPLSLDIARRDPALGRGLLDALIRREPSDSPLREQIFLDFMRGRRPPEGAVLGSRELEAAIGQASWLPWAFVSGIGVLLAVALWFWLPFIDLPSPRLPRFWAVDAGVYRWTAYFGSTCAALGLVAEFTGLFAGLSNEQAENWLKPLRWVGRHVARPAVRIGIDAGLSLAVMAGMGLLVFTFVEGYPAWDIPVLSGIGASALTLVPRRVWAGQPPPPAEKSYDPAALLRRPEQLTLVSNLAIAMGLAVALNIGLYGFLEQLSKQRMDGFANLLAAAALQVGLLLAAPIGAGLFALKTALRLDAKSLVLLVAVAWLGGMAGELAATGWTRYVSQKWELFHDFSVEFMSALLVLGVVGIRLRLGDLRLLGSAVYQCIGMLLAPYSVLLFFSAEVFDGFFMFAATPAVILAGFGYVRHIRTLPSSILRKAWHIFRAFFDIGIFLVPVILVAGFFVVVTNDASTYRWLGISENNYLALSFFCYLLLIPWLYVFIEDRPARIRENFVPVPLPAESRSLPLFLGVLACLLSVKNGLGGLDFNAALIPFAIYMGSRHAWRGLWLLAVGGLPLLFPKNVFSDYTGAGNPGFYIACLLACRLSFDRAWLTRCLTASRWQLADTLLLFLSGCLSTSTRIGELRFYSYWSMQNLYFFTIFMLGFSVIQWRVLSKPFAIAFALLYATTLLGADTFTVWKGCEISMENVAQPNNLLLSVLLYTLGRWLSIVLLRGDLCLHRWSARFIRRPLSKKWMIPVFVLCLMPVGFRIGYGQLGVRVGLYNDWTLYCAFAAYAMWLSIKAKPPSAPAETGNSFQVVAKLLALFLPLAIIPPLLSSWIELFYPSLLFNGFKSFGSGIFRVQSIDPISHPIILAVYGLLGWQLGKKIDRLPELANVPRHHIRAAARPLPYMQSRWLWPLAAGGLLAFVGGIWQAVARLL